MANPLKWLFSNNNGKEQSNQESGLKFTVSGSASGKINSDLLIKLLAFILGGGIIVTPVLDALPEKNPSTKNKLLEKVTVIEEAETEKSIR